jgi:predicted metalloprotease with PDZ domain
MSVPVSYRIRASSPDAHLFDVRLTVRQPSAQGQVFTLPAWIPGSYMIREFARNIVSLQAECKEQAVVIHKLDKHTWQAEPVDGVLTLRYQVYAFDLSVRGAYLDGQRGFFNPSSLCLAVAGQEQEECEIEIERPRGKPFQDWQLATGLAPHGKKIPEDGFGRYRAASFDELIDHPVEMGCFERLRFKACGIAHELVVSGRFHADLKRLVRDARKICEWQINLFGQPAPFSRYVFMLYVGQDVYGGLEHRNSTALMAARDDLPRSGDQTISDGYLCLLGLISHEYFHSWNVKRIKPAAFSPYDLTCENYTRLLWAFEGVTSYYDDLTLLRCGLIDRERYLGLLAKTLSAVERGSGRLKQTLEESSFDAWVKYYRQDENSPNSIVSYYAKGALVALALDLLVRQQSAGTQSLDDVMRALWQKWLDDGQGLQEDEWEHLAAQVTGCKLSAFFDLALRSTSALPLPGLLAEQGVLLEWISSASASATEPLPRVELGVKTAADAIGVRLKHVYDGGAAQAAGLSANDLLVAIDGLRVTDLERALMRIEPGSAVEIHAFRRDELLVFKARPTALPADACRLSLLSGSSDWLDQK